MYSSHYSAIPGWGCGVRGGCTTYPSVEPVVAAGALGRRVVLLWVRNPQVCAGLVEGWLGLVERNDFDLKKLGSDKRLFWTERASREENHDAPFPPTPPPVLAF